jgi:hypothetical protein
MSSDELMSRPTREWKDLIGNAIHKLRNENREFATKVCDELYEFETCGGLLPDAVRKLWEKLTAQLKG